MDQPLRGLEGFEPKRFSFDDLDSFQRHLAFSKVLEFKRVSDDMCMVDYLGGGDWSVGFVEVWRVNQSVVTCGVFIYRKERVDDRRYEEVPTLVAAGLTDPREAIELLETHLRDNKLI